MEWFGDLIWNHLAMIVIIVYLMVLTASRLCELVSIVYFNTVR